MTSKRAIGIDLGTTYTCAAIVEGNQARVIKSRLGYQTIPSVVTYDDQDAPVVGHTAERRMVLQPHETIYGSKRLIGRTVQSGAIAQYQPHFAYTLVPDADGFIAARVCGRDVSILQVATLILREIRAVAVSSLGEDISRAVITVPAYFNENQRIMVREAGRRANLEVIRIINEPTAAALTYGAGGRDRKQLLVFDLGGGTFDVSVVSIDGFVYTVKAVDGDTFLGGIDFDQRLVALLVERLSTRLRREAEIDAVGLERLRTAAQEAKHQLSVQQNTVLQVPHFALADGTIVEVVEKVTREELEEATRDLWERALEVVERTLEGAGLRTNDIDDVLLVGGQTRMPVLRERLRALFGVEPTKRVHADEAVALGAAIAADSDNRIDAPVVLDVAPMPIWLVQKDGRHEEIIRANTPVPHEVTVDIDVPPKSRDLELVVFEGLSMRSGEVEYLGTLHVGELRPVDAVVSCSLRFALDSEGILSVGVSIPELNIQRGVVLATQSAPEEVLSAQGMERIRTVGKTPGRPSTSADRGGPGSLPTADRAARERSRRPGLFRQVINWFKAG